MPVVVVTDSSSRLPHELRERWAIRQVSLHVLLGGSDLRDGEDAIPEDIYERGEASTAAVAPAELCAAFRQALTDSDGDGVVAVHISAALSGTVSAAQTAAADFGDAVRVIDSRSAAMGTGFASLAAARAAADGADLDTVARVAQAAAQRCHAFVVVHRLDNLRRSGRMGGAAAWLGTALSLKPLLHIDDGELVLAQRVRTASKAVAAMLDRVCEVVGDNTAAVAVHHVANPDGAADVAAALTERLPASQPAIVTDLGPVLGLHVGPGALAVCVAVDPPGSSSA